MKSDPILRGIIIVLLLAGFFILASASIGITASQKLPAHYFLLRQLVTGGIAGLILFFMAGRIPYKRWRSFSLFIFILGLGLAAAVFLPQVGLEAGGAKRWLAFGPITFQPAEFLKFGFILYLAAYFSSSGRRVNSLSGGLLPFLVAVGLVGILLIFQKDLGTLVVTAFSGLSLFWVAGGKFRHILISVLLGGIIFAALVYVEPYRLSRISVFVNPDHEPQGAGYQIKQALIAIGSGGVFGRGFGMSRQKFQYLPEPMGDSIFAVAAEEFGFVGSLILIFMFLAFAWRGFYVSRHAPDTFGKLFSSGLVILIVLPSLVNIAALSGLLPLTGIPLIFVSQGGSALAMTLLEVGILLNISKTS